MKNPLSMSVNGRMRDDTHANSLLRCESLRDMLGPNGTKPGRERCKSGACTVRVEREPSLPASRRHTPACHPKWASWNAFPSLLYPMRSFQIAPIWRNSKPDNSCVTRQDNSFGP
jgi:hypothetical protein